MTENPIELIPIARLLFELHQSGVLDPKPAELSESIEPAFRCQKCLSPRTRMKDLQAIACGLGPIIGFRLRGRCCGALNEFHVATVKGAVAA